jgi:hypothetical protein
VIPLFKRWFIGVTGMTTIGSSKGGSYEFSSQKASKAGSNGVPRSKDSKKKKFRHPLSLPTLPTKFGSDEDITMDQQTMGTGGRARDPKATTDNISEITEEDQSTYVELDDLTAQPRNQASISNEPNVGHANTHPHDIMVTREWDVARKLQTK